MGLSFIFIELRRVYRICASVENWTLSTGRFPTTAELLLHPLVMRICGVYAVLLLVLTSRDRPNH